MGRQMILLLLLAAAGCLSHSVRHKRQSSSFQEIIRQRSFGNNGISQCPCVMHPESRQCVVYDSRYQATTIEEAVLTFSDLTRDGFDPYPFPVNSATFTCQTAECQHCFGLLYYRLIEIGFIDSNYRPLTSLLPRHQLNPSMCHRYKFTLPHFIPPPAVQPDYVRKLISAGMRYRQSGVLQALPRHFFNRGRFRPGPRPIVSSTNRNQEQQQKTQPQQPSRQGGGNANGMVWNGFTRRWENHSRNQQPTQQSTPLIVPGRQKSQQWQQQGQNGNHLIWNGQTRRWEEVNQGRQWTQQTQQQVQQNAQQWAQTRPQQQTLPQQIQQQPQIWPQQQIQQQNWIQQPQAQTQQQVQAQSQWVQTQQVPQAQINQQWSVQQPPQQASWGAQQWTGQQGSQWNGPQFQSQWPSQQPIQESLLHTALQQSHQVLNPLAQQVANPSFPGPQGGSQSGQGGGQAGGQTGIVGSVVGGIFGGKRKKREVDPLIGRKFTISCIRRGETTNEDGEFLSLCGTCWTWRQLPEDYFPRILNELTCQENDYCLSGWGQCSQQFRNVDVLRRVDGRWVPTVLTTSTCCDCRVKVGNEIHGLIVGDKQKLE